MSERQRASVSKPRPEEVKKQISESLKGKRDDEATRRRKSEAAKKRWAKKKKQWEVTVNITTEEYYAWQHKAMKSGYRPPFMEWLDEMYPNANFTMVPNYTSKHMTDVFPEVTSLKFIFKSEDVAIAFKLAWGE